MEPEAHDIEVEEILPPPKPSAPERSGVRQRYRLAWNDDGTYRMVQLDPTSNRELIMQTSASTETIVTLSKEEVFAHDGGSVDNRDSCPIYSDVYPPGEWWNPRAYL